MNKTLTALAAAATMAIAIVATPQTAQARHGGWWGPGIAGAIIGGAIIGGALASPYAYGYPPPAYGYYPGPYYGGPVYYRPAPYSCVRRAWNGYRWVRVYVC